MTAYHSGRFWNRLTDGVKKGITPCKIMLRATSGLQSRINVQATHAPLFCPRLSHRLCLLPLLRSRPTTLTVWTGDVS